MQFRVDSQRFWMNLELQTPLKLILKFSNRRCFKRLDLPSGRNDTGFSRVLLDFLLTARRLSKLIVWTCRHVIRKVNGRFEKILFFREIIIRWINDEMRTLFGDLKFRSKMMHVLIRGQVRISSEGLRVFVTTARCMFSGFPRTVTLRSTVT